jgi:hypothetical protein
LVTSRRSRAITYPPDNDLEAVLEQAGAPGVVVTIGDAVHGAARVTARRPDLVDALVVPGGSPAGRARLEGSDALVASDSVLDAFLSMGATDYRGALRTSRVSGQSPDERGGVEGAGQPPGLPSAAGDRGRQVACVAQDDATEAGRACGDRLWLLYAEGMTGGWFPAGEEGRRLARRLFPDAHVEEVEDGMISRPDLVAGFVRRVTSKGRAAAT